MVAVLNDLTKILKRHLENGEIVRFGDFGSFQVTLGSSGAETEAKFHASVSGDYLTIDGQKYVICDPTYIGASIGMNSSRYKNQEAEIVRTKKL